MKKTLFIFLSLWLLWGCETAPPSAPALQIDLQKTTFQNLPGWEKNDFLSSFLTFKASCFAVLKPSYQTPAALADSLQKEDLQKTCAAAAQQKNINEKTARQFFETYFTPFQIWQKEGSAKKQSGLFTGYYEIELAASPVKTMEYQTPLHARPDNLLRARLADFDPNLTGEIWGQSVGQNFVPYPARAEINQGKLPADTKILAWLRDETDLLFLQIQGSGVLKFPDSRTQRVGYAAKNGRAYFAVGRALIARGIFTPEEMSMQNLRGWLKANPEEAQKIIAQNESYIFFDKNDAPGARGAIGVVLTPQKSLAVDPQFVAYGLPVFVATTHPLENNPWQSLMIAQDTGSAIRGPIRGDIFFGTGKAAEDWAGPMKQDGKAFLLLPKRMP